MGRTIALVALLVLAIAVSGVASYAEQLTVSVEKSVYRPGETVVITGTGPANRYIGLSILNPQGLEVHFAIIKVGSDGTYRAEVKLPPEVPYENWIYGKYTVRVYYGSLVKETYFELAPAGAITGKVVDESGKPITDAEVLIVETGAKTYTDTEGKFAITVKEGSYTLIISKPGYRSVELKVDVETGKTVDVGTVTLVSYDYLISLLNATVSELETKIAELKDKLATIETAYTAVSESLDEISKSLDEIKNSLATLATAVEGVSSEVSKVSGQLDSISGKVDAVSSKIDGLKDQLSAIATGVSNNKAAIDALSKSVAQISTKLEDISSSIAAVKGDISKVKSDILDAVSSVASDVTAVKNTVSGLQTSISDVSKSVSDLSGKIDTVKSAVEAKAGELTTLIVVTLILALIAAAASIYTTIQMVKKLAG